MKRPLDPRVPEDEAALFRAAMRDAVPLRAPTRHERAQPAHPPVPIQSLLDEHAALDESRTGALDDEARRDRRRDYLRRRRAELRGRRATGW
jgi:hypothetical protein